MGFATVRFLVALGRGTVMFRVGGRRGTVIFLHFGVSGFIGRITGRAGAVSFLSFPPGTMGKLNSGSLKPAMLSL